LSTRRRRGKLGAGNGTVEGGRERERKHFRLAQVRDEEEEGLSKMKKRMEERDRIWDTYLLTHTYLIELAWRT